MIGGMKKEKEGWWCKGTIMFWKKKVKMKIELNKND